MAVQTTVFLKKLPGNIFGHRAIAQRQRLFQAAIVALLCLAIALASGMFRLDPQIAGKWTGYHYGDVNHRLRNINLADALGAAGVVLDYRDRTTLRAIEDHDQNWYFDDIGYILFAQLYVLMSGEPLEEADILIFHNAAFVAGLICISAMMTLILGGLAPGIFSFLAFAGLHDWFSGFVYNTASQPGIVIPMVAWGVAALLGLSFVLDRARRRWFDWAAIALAGALFGTITLVRYPIGSGALLAAIFAILIARHNRVGRAVAAAFLIGGSLLAQVGVPGFVTMHRDAKLDWERPFFSYFEPPPKHKPWFTILAVVGRYPNALDLVIRDSGVDALLSARKQAQPERWPEPYHANFDDIARDVLFEYVAAHPLEFLSQRLRGALELPAVIPAVTFQSRDNFAGSPSPTDKTEALVDPRDFRLSSDLLINVKWKYVDLSPAQWAAYLAGLAALIVSFTYAIRRWRRDPLPSRAVVCLGGLLALYGASRALIPWYGQDFVFLFWALAAIGGGWLLAKAGRAYLADRRGVGGRS